MKGDVDVVTSAKAIEVKSGNLNNLGPEELVDLHRQLQTMKTFATARGIEPVLCIEQAQSIPDAVQRVIDSVGGITVNRF
ncbi:MAG TPA: hypothetical protein VGR35_16675 [Tepidisphaeraceae bacterium]|nr:hypothetical protein [Tepidisphaeraceae bacterium]